MQEGGDDLLDYQQDGLLAHGQPDLLVGEEQVEKEDCLVEVDSCEGTPVFLCVLPPSAWLSPAVPDLFSCGEGEEGQEAEG